MLGGSALAPPSPGLADKYLHAQPLACYEFIDGEKATVLRPASAKHTIVEMCPPPSRYRKLAGHRLGGDLRRLSSSHRSSHQKLPQSVDVQSFQAPDQGCCVETMGLEPTTPCLQSMGLES